jgi:transcriptional regulator with XRE-family HTH domain
MSATLELFDRWKALKNITSDRQASAALGLSAGAAAQWRMGRNGSAAVIERMARDLGEDPIPVILQAFAEAARDAEDRKTLGRLARKLGAACLALFVLAPMVNSSAAATESGVSETPHHIHYAKWIARQIARLSRSVSLARARWLTPTEPPTCSHLASSPAFP